MNIIRKQKSERNIKDFKIRVVGRKTLRASEPRVFPVHSLTSTPYSYKDQKKNDFEPKSIQKSLTFSNAFNLQKSETYKVESVRETPIYRKIETMTCLNFSDDYDNKSKTKQLPENDETFSFNLKPLGQILKDICNYQKVKTNDSYNMNRNFKKKLRFLEQPKCELNTSLDKKNMSIETNDTFEFESVKPDEWKSKHSIIKRSNLSKRRFNGRNIRFLKI